MTNSGYWMLVLPYVSVGASCWHPVDSTGPFSSLVRGAFSTKVEAMQWIKRERLCKGTYKLRFVKEENT